MYADDTKLVNCNSNIEIYMNIDKCLTLVLTKKNHIMIYNAEVFKSEFYFLPLSLHFKRTFIVLQLPFIQECLLLRSTIIDIFSIYVFYAYIFT